MTLISVVIPAYNAAQYIGDAVEAALSQTHDDLEVIVVDDGSQDSTAEVVNGISDSRVKLLQQPNAGQSAAINNGVARSKGNYIKLLDADDWMNPEHIAAQLEVLDGSDDIIASCRWGYFVNEFRSPFVRSEATNRSYDDPLEWIVDSLTKDEGMMGGWMWLIPRGVWDAVGGFDPRLSLNNDFYFSLSILLSSRAVCYAQEAVYSYRKGVSGALSGSFGRSAMESAFLTTELGIQALLARENSERTRRIGADRFQSWLFRFFPEYPDLVQQAEERIRQLGGSEVALPGGTALKVIAPIIGWRNVRKLQTLVRRLGWNVVLRRKCQERLTRLG
jgi:glycosyltransferase involved in cell wall biosynthesis